MEGPLRGQRAASIRGGFEESKRKTGGRELWGVGAKNKKKKTEEGRGGAQDEGWSRERKKIEKEERERGG